MIIVGFGCRILSSLLHEPDALVIGDQRRGRWLGSESQSEDGNTSKGGEIMVEGDGDGDGRRRWRRTAASPLMVANDVRAGE